MAEKIEQRVQAPGAKRILSLDGGGVMGVITLQYLERIEAILAERASNKDRFRLCDYFDLIGGASTGAIIGTLLALGWRVRDIRDLYFEFCPRVFKRGSVSLRNVLSSIGLMSKFDTQVFSNEVDRAFSEVARRAGVEPGGLTLSSDELRTGLAIVAKRIDTNSVWVQTNIPGRRFWSAADQYWWPDGGGFVDNSSYSLKAMVRASASAPYFFEEVALDIAEDQLGVFVDGGVSPHNNPSKELFLMAALRDVVKGGRSPFGLGWSTGAEKLLLISIGTGTYRDRMSAQEYQKQRTIYKAVRSLRSIIHDCSQDAVTWLQALSEPRKPWSINGKLKDMAGFRLTPEPLLSFQRFNVRLERDLLVELMGEDWAEEHLTPRKLENLRAFDTPYRANLERLEAIGAAAAKIDVEAEDLPAAFDVVQS